MLTGVFDGTKAYFYFDADLKATSSAFSSGKIGYNANNSIIVGAEAGWQENQIDTGIPVLPGKVRNVTIINSAFSSSDIARVYNAGYMASILFYGFSNRTEDIQLLMIVAPKMEQLSLLTPALQTLILEACLSRFKVA